MSQGFVFTPSYGPVFKRTSEGHYQGLRAGWETFTLSLPVTGSGSLRCVVKNAHYAGTVRVYLNDGELKSVGPNSQAVIEQSFKDGEVFKWREDGAVLEIVEISIACGPAQ